MSHRVKYVVNNLILDRCKNKTIMIDDDERIDLGIWLIIEHILIILAKMTNQVFWILQLLTIIVIALVNYEIIHVKYVQNVSHGKSIVSTFINSIVCHSRLEVIC